ncbi:hypothetical protein HNQ02_001786 [Flavobacterium sp. 7E]|uniref:DUF6503 family protein n=1 Tax=unclassified Flavobacterium TaxID=196869 RepID=UPI0015713D1B|nr:MULTISPECIES: DUF6503 family protein [unclassified Flavobacterium]MBE0393670.1 hypothetical protein [Flavobacterium sp. PL002]NRS88868.1 hypothetical protein [Flavobacterium sp. 7E]
MKIKLLTSVLLGLSLVACKNDKQTATSETQTDSVKIVAPKFENKGQELVYTMVQKVGDLSQLYDKKDVVYTYTYQTPDGKTDITTEKYIFDGQLSYGAYKKHERTLPDLSGLIEQGYDGNEFWLKNNGKSLTDEKLLKMVAFNRPTNFYWFTMMQKLLDPGVNYEYLNEKTIDSVNYDVVKITFESTDGKPKDTYQLYLNKETHLVDQFLFTVADFGKIDPLLMKLEYETIDGLMIPTKRKYKASNWDAKVTDEPWIQVNWTDIKFNNGLKKSDFKK